MIKLFTHIDSTDCGYYITHVENEPVSDEDVTKKLNLELSQYQNILKSFGAKGEVKYGECYFKRKNDAQQCIKYILDIMSVGGFKEKDKGFDIICRNCGSKNCRRSTDVVDFQEYFICNDCGQNKR